MHFSTLALPAQRVEQVFAIFVISEMQPIEPEKIARGLCLSVNYACTFGYRQNSRRHEPTRESSLGAHVRMLNRITTEKVPAALAD
jgi:hypothetical protein